MLVYSLMYRMQGHSPRYMLHISPGLEETVRPSLSDKFRKFRLH